MSWEYQKKGLEAHYEFRVPKKRDSKLIMRMAPQHAQGTPAAQQVLYCWHVQHPHNEFGVPEKGDSKLLMDFEYQER